MSFKITSDNLQKFQRKNSTSSEIKHIHRHSYVTVFDPNSFNAYFKLEFLQKTNFFYWIKFATFIKLHNLNGPSC